MASYQCPLTPNTNAPLAPKSHSLLSRPPTLPPKPPPEICFDSGSYPITPRSTRPHELPSKPRFPIRESPRSPTHRPRMNYNPTRRNKFTKRHFEIKIKQESSPRKLPAAPLTPPKEDSYSLKNEPASTTTIKRTYITQLINEDPTEKKLKEVEAKLLVGATVLTHDEQMLLWDHINPKSQKFGHTIERLATQLGNRLNQLTYKIMCWYHNHGNMAMVDRLLRERFDHIGEDWGDIMSLDEVDELMDCQIALDLAQEKLHG